MKKLFIAAIALVACVSAKAQETYAPEAGEISTEIQFNPFSNDFGTFKLDQLKLRYMFSDKDAIRFGIGFGVDNGKKVEDPDNNPDTWVKGHIATFSINLGYERHFFNYKRIDLYAGVGVGYEHVNASSKSHAEATYDGVTGFWDTKTVNEYDGIRTANYFKADIFTGIDFYVYKGLFVGAELGIGLKTGTMPGYYTEGPGYDDNGNFIANKKSTPKDKITTFSLKCFAEPALRIGWTF